MNRYSYKKYLLIGAALFLLLSLPALFVEKMRGSFLGGLFHIFKTTSSFSKGKISEEMRLEAENHFLRLELQKLRAILDQRAKTESLQKDMQHYSLNLRRYEEMNHLADLMRKAIPAFVIYRDPGSWGNVLWVNVGEETNKLFNCQIIQKNSPVILGRAVVGAIDYVGKKQSRVRLITDATLKPSVRAVRGLPQNMALIEHIDPILRHLTPPNESSLTSEERASLAKHLERLKKQLSVDVEGWYLAKGILQGAGTPLWRNSCHTLRGIGFNYDFADEEGCARELASGKPIAAHVPSPTMPIIKVHDLLVTTGMDGVFPSGLRVAEVTKIYPLREGAYTYEIEALPVVGNLDTLQTVFIIPPVGYIVDSGLKGT